MYKCITMFYSIQIMGWNVYICTPRKINMSTKKNSFQKEISGNLTKIPMNSVQNSEAYSSFWCWAPRETLWLLLDSGACALTSWNSACRCYSCCFHLNLLPTICYSLLIHAAKYQLLNFAVFFVSPFLVDLSGSMFSWEGPTQQCLESCHILGPAVWSECIYIYILPETNSFYPEK